MIRPADAKLTLPVQPLQARVSFIAHEVHRDCRVEEFGS